MQQAIPLENRKAWGTRWKPFLVHASAFLMLGLSWRYLTEWYLFSATENYLLFLTFFLAALVLATSGFLWPLLKDLPGGRFLILLAILFLYFPWSEWLQLKPSTSREDWSRQMLLQTISVYGLLLFLHSFKEISEFISRNCLRTLNFISSRKTLIFLPCLLFFIFTLWIGVFFFNRSPLVEDSAAHLFQARIFSRFQLYAPVPAPAEFFSWRGDMLAMKDGRWFSMYPPGLALLLSPGVLVHAEWLVSPLLGAITLAIWILYIIRWHDRNIAALFGWLFLLSPFFLLMFSTFMVHSPELFIATAAIFLCRRETEASSGLRQVLIACLLALGMLVRAFSLLAFLSPVLVYTTLQRLRVRSMGTPLAIFLGTVLGIALLAGYQWKTSGSPLIPGYLIEFPELTGLFAVKPEGLEIVSNNVQGMSKWLSGWHTGSFFLILAFFIFQPKFKTWDRILLFSCVLLIALYSCYLIQDQLFGPRMFFLLGPLLVLMICRLALSSTPQLIRIILPAIILCSVASLPDRIPSLIGKWKPTHYQSGNFKEQLDQLDESKSIVFLEKSISQEFVNWNDPFLKSTTVICRDLEIGNEEIAKLFPDYRRLYFKQNESFEMSKPQVPFIISQNPDRSHPDQISFFNVALAIEAAGNYSSQDFFDICYKDVLTSVHADSQLAYVSNLRFEENRIYKQAFRVGMVHVIRLLLLPMVAFDKKGTEWEHGFDVDGWRMEYKLAARTLGEAGEIGKNISGQIVKVGKRIDRDIDGNFSNEEVIKFLSQKLKNL